MRRRIGAEATPAKVRRSIRHGKASRRLLTADRRHRLAVNANEIAAGAVDAVTPQRGCRRTAT
jgi:hypothetical protein